MAAVSDGAMAAGTVGVAGAFVPQAEGAAHSGSEAEASRWKAERGEGRGAERRSKVATRERRLGEMARRCFVAFGKAGCDEDGWAARRRRGGEATIVRSGRD